MKSKVNQQQTLFRFVSLRSPELSSKDNQNRRFVFDTTVGTSYFYAPVSNRPEGQSKWEAMKIACQSFNPYVGLENIESVFADYIAPSDYIARNKATLDIPKLYELVNGLSLFKSEETKVLWDNLYFQIIEHNHFYVKELIMQLLNLQNMLIHIVGKPYIEVEPMLKELANARVVLTTEFFAEDPKTTVVEKSTKEKIFSSNGLSKSLEVSLSQSAIAANGKLIVELKEMQLDYYHSYNQLYKEYNATYNSAAMDAYAKATMVEKTTTECSSGCVVTYQDYEDLVVPVYNFIPPVEIEMSKIKETLPADSFYILEFNKLLKYTTYDSLIEAVEVLTATETQKMYANLPNPKSVIAIGAMIFQKNGPKTVPDEFLTSEDIPFIANFSTTALNPHRGRVNLVLNLGYANGDAVACSYFSVFSGETPLGGTAFTDTANSNILNITCHTDSIGMEVPTGKTTFDFSASVTLVNGTKIDIKCVIPILGRTTGVGTIVSQVSTNNGNNTMAFVPKDFGIRTLGIADYKKVVSEVCCYRESEVAHIENIMAREFKNKTTTRERIEERTTTTERSTEVENLTDSTSTERFEMQTEIAKLLAEQKDFNAYANVKGSYGQSVTFEAGAAYATNTTKEESNRQAVTQAKELTQRAMERIVTKFREELVVKITESFKEENSHIFDNRDGQEHVSGVYRYINAIYKNQIYNYGKRLMYEFMIPQPSKLYRNGLIIPETGGVAPTGNTPVLPVFPEDPVTQGMGSSVDLLATNYRQLAAKYQAEVEAPPAEFITLGKSYSGKGNNASFAKEFNDLKVPEGYQVKKIHYKYVHRHSDRGNLSAQLMIANESIDIFRNTALIGYPTKAAGTINFVGQPKNSFDNIPVSVAGWDVGNFAVNITVEFERLLENFSTWQTKTYDIIMRAYKERLDEYNSSLQQTQDDGVVMMGTNPLFYRQIEQSILKKNCLSYLLEEEQMGQGYYTGGDSFANYKVTRSQDMDNYASQAKFMEQAFEWDIMSYNFYPYYWGDRNDWVQLYQSENDDPLFRSFMQSGMARVIVSVKPGFEDAAMHYMATREIWNGGQMPVIGEPLYLSIVEELAEQEYTIEETWETVLPTSLIGLQRGGVSIDADGLPCGNGCESEDENKLIPNDNKLGPEVPTVTPYN